MMQSKGASASSFFDSYKSFTVSKTSTVVRVPTSKPDCIASLSVNVVKDNKKLVCTFEEYEQSKYKAYLV